MKKGKLRFINKMISLNVFAYHCPDCAVPFSDKFTAKFCGIWDEQYKVYKYFIKCKCCGNVTPAFEDPKKALDNWEDLFIKKEIQLVLES